MGRSTTVSPSAAILSVSSRGPHGSGPRKTSVAPARRVEKISSTEASGALYAQGTTSERVGEIAAASGIVLHELRLEQSSLEEVFLELTSEKAE